MKYCSFFVQAFLINDPIFLLQVSIFQYLLFG
jgi:hypothetical protein